MQPRELAEHVRRSFPGPSPPFTVQELPDGILLGEVGTGKTLRLPADAVVDVTVRQDWTSGAAYLRLELAERPPLALTAAGFAFALDTRHTGPLASAPPAMSFADYARLHRHLLHLLESLADPHQRREALDVTLVLIASLDGARAVGLAVDVEEAALEAAIRRLEAGA